MSNPNLLGLSAVRAGRVGAALGTTSNTAVLTNASSSNHLYMVTSIYASNVDGVNAADLNINLNNGTRYKIVNTVSVPADATLVPVVKEATIYMLEGDILEAWASASGDIELLVMYLDLS